MKDIEFTVSDIKDIMNTFSKNKLGSLKIKQGDFILKLEGCKVDVVTAAISSTPSPFDSASAAAPAVEAPAGNVIKSPIVGTFYAASAPDKPPYVTTGSKVKKGDVLFIIESMKLMNEVTSDFDGTVGEIFAKNGEAVEYGQAIMTIE